MKSSYGSAIAAVLMGAGALAFRTSAMDDEAVTQTSTIAPPVDLAHIPAKTQSVRQRARYARQIEAGQCNLDPVTGLKL